MTKGNGYARWQYTTLDFEPPIDVSVAKAIMGINDELSSVMVQHQK